MAKTKTKTKLNIKQFLLAKGEYVAMGVAGFFMVILLLWGITKWSSAKDPTQTVKDLTNNAQRVNSGLQNTQLTDADKEIAAVPAWVSTAYEFKHVPAAAFQWTSPQFDPTAKPDTKKENPNVYAIGAYQVDMMRGAMKGYDISDGANGEQTIAVIFDKRIDPLDRAKALLLSKNLKNQAKGARHNQPPPGQPQPPPGGGGPFGGGPLGGGPGGRGAGMGGMGGKLGGAYGPSGDGFETGSQRTEKAIEYIALDQLDKVLEKGKVPAMTVIPLRMVTIHAEIPLKKQIEEIKRRAPLAGRPRRGGVGANLRRVRNPPPGYQASSQWGKDRAIGLVSGPELLRLRAGVSETDQFPEAGRQLRGRVSGPLHPLRDGPGLAAAGTDHRDRRGLSAHPAEEYSRYDPEAQGRVQGSGRDVRYAEAAPERHHAGRPVPPADEWADRRRNLLRWGSRWAEGAGQRPNGADGVPGAADGAGRGRGPRGSSMQGNPNDPNNVNLSAPVEIEHLLLRFVDVNVKPGETYEYQIRLRMMNPNYKRVKEVSKPADAEVEVLFSPWTQLADSITIPMESFLYASDWSAYSKKIKDEHEKERVLMERLQVKDNQAVVETCTWMEQIKTGEGGKREPVGAWVVADFPVARGEYIGRKSYVKLPLWSSENRTYVLREIPDKVNPPKNGKESPQPRGWLIDFSGNKAILVDFEGGKVQTKVSGKSVTEETATEMLVLRGDDRLVVKSSAMDESDPDRKDHISKWEKWVKEVAARKASAEGSNEFSPRPPGGGGGNDK